MTGWPSVGVVIPTCGRPESVRTAVEAVLSQDYPGEVQVVVVHDGHAPGDPIVGDPRVRQIANSRAAGLPGARNCGILALDTDLVAFCDDDDEWLAGKLVAQVSALQAEPGAEFVSCSIRVEYGERSNVRLAGRDRITHDDLVRSRMAMVHSSTFLMTRSSVVGSLGLVNENAPYGQNEDWDLVLRASARQPIVHVDEPLVRVVWAETSQFSRKWEPKAESLRWMLIRHPDIDRGSGGARVYGQIAFAYACLGKRAEAARWAVGGWRRNWREPRVPIALAVASGLVSPDTVLNFLHSRGHGI